VKSFSLPELARIRKKIIKILTVDLDIVDKPLADVYTFNNLCINMERHILRRPGDYSTMLDEGDGGYDEESEAMAAHKKARVLAVANLLDDHREGKATQEIIKTIALQIAGRLELLRAGLHRDPDSRPENKVWSCLMVRDVVRIRARKRTYRVSLESIAGNSAGSKWKLVASGNYLQKLLREVGLPKYDEYGDADIGGMSLSAFVYIYQGKLVVDAIEVSSSQKNYNRKLTKARSNICTGPSPAHHDKYTCRYCPVGRSECPISRIDESFSVLRECEWGHNGYFRKTESPERERICLACRLVGRFKQ